MKLLSMLCVVSLLLLFGCNTVQYVTVPLDYNAKYYFKPDTTTIVVVNRFSVTPEQVGNAKKRNVIKAGAYTAVKYAAFGLNTIKHVNAIAIADSVNFSANTDSVNALSKKYHADYVLVLKDFATGISLSSIDAGSSYYNAQTTVKFVLYEPNSNFHKNLEGTADDPQSQQPYFNVFASLLIHPTVKGNVDAVTASAQHATEIALQDYFPYTITNTRPLYNDDYLQPTVKLIMQGEYDKADSLMQPLLKSRDDKVLSRTAYNLSVVYEAEGFFDAAINMAQFSIDKQRNQFAITILEALKKE